MKGRILIIDDVEGIRDTMASFLTDLGYEVCSAGDGETGLRMLKEFDPHLLFLDILMPKMDGLQVIRMIRDQNSLIPVVMITGYDNPGIARELLLAGATDFIRKPVRFEYVQRLVEACLAKQPRNLQGSKPA